MDASSAYSDVAHINIKEVSALLQAFLLYSPY